MAWRKSPPELIAAFQAAVPQDPRVERRTMFGYPSCFVGGHLTAGLHQESVVARLPAGRREELLALPGAAVFEPMPGRTMRELVVLPPSEAADPRRLGRWLREAVDYSATLPPKPRKPAKPAKAAKTTEGAKPAARRRR